MAPILYNTTNFDLSAAEYEDPGMENKKYVCMGGNCRQRAHNGQTFECMGGNCLRQGTSSMCFHLILFVFQLMPSLNYFIVDNGNDFLCKGGNCDDQLTDVSSAFSSPFFSG